MFARINHIAIISPQYAMLGKFYESLFGMKPGSSPPESAVSHTDGNVGLQILPRRDGYIAGLDHFGILVDDLGAVETRMRAYEDAAMVKRPSSRPFAAYSANDPDGNHFDLAEAHSENLKEVYAEDAREQDRWVNLYAVRTPHADRVADYYQEVFELAPVKQDPDDLGYTLSDGRVMLRVLPWSMTYFEGMAIKTAWTGTLRVHVGDLGTFRSDLARLTGGNTLLAPVALGGSAESDVRRRLFESGARGKLQIADTDGVWIDITDE